ncbi:cyclic nucleotide-binding domain-containing protein [Rubrobacter taiwanensis]|uniref:cyclic nucleotide-binding domain-containing protein n=1 Tax=Rubrobacter taiwanensis TaxID=185139 RepID=UPI00140546C8|nr:cyclic nucleotide-binding domain-containing protein [Rubrobacter taiwanensis]
MTGDRLKEIGLFESLGDEGRAEFAAASEEVRFSPGEAIIEEGTEPDSMYVLLSGRAEVYRRVRGGVEERLAAIDADDGGAVVGERGLLRPSPASATVRAVDAVEAVRIPRQVFRRMIEAGHPAAYELAYRISRTLARRLVQLDEEAARAIRRLEDRPQDAELEVFRDRLITEWSV